MNEKKPPFYLLDLLKLVVLTSIVILHSNEFIFFTDHVFWGTQAPMYYLASFFARANSIGGQVLILCIYFLFGFTGKIDRSLLRLSGIALCGQIILTLIFMGESTFISALEWDIYSYLLLSNIFLVLLPLRLRRSFLLGTFCFLMLWIPPLWLKSLSDSLLWKTLTGHAYPESSGSWPLLPWFFLALLSFQIGMAVRENRIHLNHWYRWEKYLWPILFLLALPQLGAYFNLPIGANYYRFAFNQPPYVFWSNFLIYLFWFRIAFLPSVQEACSRKVLFKLISSLNWCRKVGLSYIISLAILGLGSLWADVFRSSPQAFDMFFLSIMPLTEVLTRLIVKCTSLMRRAHA